MVQAHVAPSHVKALNVPKRTSRRPRRTSRRPLRRNAPKWPWSKRDGEPLFFGMVMLERGGERSYTRNEWVEHLCVAAIEDLKSAYARLTDVATPGSIGESGHEAWNQRAALSFIMAAHRALGEAKMLASMLDERGETYMKRYVEYAHVFEGEWRLLVREWDLLPE